MTEKEAQDFLKKEAQELNKAVNALREMKFGSWTTDLETPKKIRNITYLRLRIDIAYSVAYSLRGYSFKEGGEIFHKAIPLVQTIKRIARETKGVALRQRNGKLYFCKKDIPSFVQRVNGFYL